MFRRFTKKRVGIGVAAIAALALAAGAYAYFTGTGSGTGSASVGNATNTITVSGTETAPLYPGGPSGQVSFKASNGSTYSQKISKIQLTSVAVDTSSTTYTTASAAQQTTWNGCDVTSGTAVAHSDPAFSMADVTVGSDGDLASSASNSLLTETGALYMNDTGADQSNCEGAPLKLSFTTS